MTKGHATYDVLVVGAGPAGSTAAGRCAELGLKTILLDRQLFPRFKACGGGLTRAAQELMGRRLPRESMEVHCDRLIADFGGRRLEVQMPRPFMATVERKVFDQRLVDGAAADGAEFAPGWEVEDVTEAPDGRYVAVAARPAPGAGTWNNATGPGGMTLKASLLIAADGALGKVTRRLAGPLGKDDLAFCLVADAEPDGDAGRVVGKRGIMCFYGVLGAGYGWIFPRRDRLNVGLGAPVSGTGTEAVTSSWPKFLESNGLRLLGKPRGAFVPVGGLRRTVSGGRWLLAGDAAGLADPFSGEGIRYAVGSGLAAAEAAAAFLDGDSDSLHSYRRRLYQAFGRDLRLASQLQRYIARRPRVMEGLFMSDSAPFRDLLGILDGTATYRGLLRSVLPQLPRVYLTSSFKS